MPILLGLAGGVALGVLLLVLAWLFTPRRKRAAPIPPPPKREEVRKMVVMK